jgi:hypothetical protein
MRLCSLAPDAYLRTIFKQVYPDKAPVSEEEFIRSIHQRREVNPDFLEPLGMGAKAGQLHLQSSGTHYAGAKLTAQLTGSYLALPSEARHPLARA